MEEINNKINETVAKIAVAEGGDFTRRNTLETLLVELHSYIGIRICFFNKRSKKFQVSDFSVSQSSLHDVVDMSICRNSPAGLSLFIMIYYHYFAFVLNFVKLRNFSDCHLSSY
jgi:hypothetical protein